MTFIVRINFYDDRRKLLDFKQRDVIYIEISLAVRT